MKLPDEMQQQIREEFQSPGTITNPVRFTDMTTQWLTQDEARLR